MWVFLARKHTHELTAWRQGVIDSLLSRNSLFATRRATDSTLLKLIVIEPCIILCMLHRVMVWAKSVTSWFLINSSLWTYPVEQFLLCVQDKLDDLRLGIKSTAIKFGEHTKPVLSVFGGVMVCGLLLSGVQTAQLWPYYSSVAVVAAHLANQVQQILFAPFLVFSWHSYYFTISL